MSVNYGNAGGYVPPRKVNFGWIGESFNLFQQNAGVWIVATLGVVFIPIIFSYIVTFAATRMGVYHPYTPTPGTPVGTIFAQSIVQSYTGLSLGIQIINYLFDAFLYAGLYQMANKTVRGEAISFGDIFSGGSRFLPMAGFLILYGLATTLGGLLLIIPGIILAGMLFPGHALTADGESPVTAFSRSFQAMKADWASAAGFMFVMGLLIFVSALPCGLGTFVTLPMLFLATALAYRDMIGMPMGAGAVIPAYGVPQAGTWPPPPTVSSSPFAQTPPAQPSAPMETPQPPAASNPFGQPPNQAANPFGQPPAPTQNPYGQTPPRTSLSGDPIDDDKPQT